MTITTFNRSFPATRMRRGRRSPFIRALHREHNLHRSDLVQPLFVIPGSNQTEPIPSLLGQNRYSVDRLVTKAEQLFRLGIQAVMLFPVIESDKRSADAREALNPEGLLPTAIAALHDAIPEIGIITDIALDPYTSHGHDGILGAHGQVSNDATVALLCQQALCHVRAGASIIAPSDMMDGRIGAIRNALEQECFSDTLILAYAAKYASAFYGPFRDAVQSAGMLGRADKKNYQMDIANGDEALHEVALDVAEGADMVMIKPGMPYLDILSRVKKQFLLPTWAYQVSGEYAMLEAAIEKQWLDEKVILESLIAFKRAGADVIVSYFAERVVAGMDGEVSS